MKKLFEFVTYDGSGNFLWRETRQYRSDNTARKAAGRFAIKADGRCDVAHAGDDEWASRYMTTARPCPYSLSGYYWEKNKA